MRGGRTKTSGQGRPKGIPNKVTSSVKAMVLEALNKAGGADYLLQQANLNPSAFMVLVGKLIPTELEATLKRDPREFTREELIAVIAGSRDRAASEDGRSGEHSVIH